MKKLLITEPDFKEKPIEWVSWNIKNTGNSMQDALTILRQKQILSSF
tara:strand:+ start:959 stop:1099 length:141 start_codon:yes stop_codon:yes gene_type:complete